MVAHSLTGETCQLLARPVTGRGGSSCDDAVSAPAAHRPDIDGLRAVAILPILLLHCGIAKLRGGFVGVDIFFVISGYLITGIIARETVSGCFTLTAFYRRRIVRILPALTVMMTIVLALGCATMLPNPIRDMGKSAAATSLFVSNFYFWSTSDYFAAGSDAKPFIHTWSLAVEEQFYLFFPLALMGLRGQSRRRLVMVVGSAALASLACGAWLAIQAPSAGFFLLPARVFELMAGALVALGALPEIRSDRIRDWLCGAALALIGVSCVITSSGWSFPVPFAIPPVVGAAVLLGYGETAVTARILSWAPARAIGLISYSLYLWHRPVIAFYQMRNGTTLAPRDTVLLIGISLVLAWLSYRVVERPALRRWRDRAGIGVHLTGFALLAGMAAAGLAIAANADAIRPLSPAAKKVASYLGYDTTAAGRAQFDTDRCFTIPTGKPFDAGHCLALADDRPNVLLLGDSHAAQFSQALRQRLSHANVLQATAAGCRPLLNGRGLARCRDVMNLAFHGIDLERIDTVVLAGRWLDAETLQLLETIAYLRRAHVRVIVIGPMVEYDLDMPELVVRAMLDHNWARLDHFRLRDRQELDRQLEPLISHAGAKYLSIERFECPTNHCDLLAGDGVPVHFDHSHLTNAAAKGTINGPVASYLRSVATY